MAEEIELKFEIKDYYSLIQELIKECNFVSSSYELTIMYDKDKELLKKDDRLRLRKIINIKNNFETCELSYKHPKSREEIKIEEEYETEVKSFKETEHILNNLGFFKVSSYERIRDLFYLNNIKITVDSFPFGDYVEFEGQIDQIQNLANKFGFKIENNLTKACDDLYLDFCVKNKKEVKDDIAFESEEIIELQKEKRKQLLKT